MTTKTDVLPGVDCPRCGGTVEARSYGVACGNHGCNWDEYHDGARKAMERRGHR